MNDLPVRRCFDLHIVLVFISTWFQVVAADEHGSNLFSITTISNVLPTC